MNGSADAGLYRRCPDVARLVRESLLKCGGVIKMPVPESTPVVRLIVTRK